MRWQYWKTCNQGGSARAGSLRLRLYELALQSAEMITACVRGRCVVGGEREGHVPPRWVGRTARSADVECFACEAQMLSAD